MKPVRDVKLVYRIRGEHRREDADENQREDDDSAHAAKRLLPHEPVEECRQPRPTRPLFLLEY